MPTISVDVGTVDVDIDLSDFDDDELADELEDRGYTVIYHTDYNEFLFSKSDTELLLTLIDRENAKPGTDLHRIRDVLVYGVLNGS